MIVRIDVQLGIRDQALTHDLLAYPLYAWLLSKASWDYGESLHEQNMRPISQHVWYDRITQQSYWTLNLLNECAAEQFLPVMEHSEEAMLHRGAVTFVNKQVEIIDSADAFFARAKAQESPNRYAMEFVAPTAFKQNGRYVIFPQEGLILRSLIMRWNECFPETPLDDDDAFDAMLRGLHITDYSLRTVRHPLKQTRIPSFKGRIILESRLPAPLSGLFSTLYHFTPYAGIGIKTALGMGGVRIEE